MPRDGGGGVNPGLSIVAKHQISLFRYRQLHEPKCAVAVNPPPAHLPHSTRHAPVRQNFTIGHELGHLLLHDQEQLHVDHEFRVRLRDDVSSQGTDEAEREANFFAASLLMPKDFLEADLAKEDYVDLLDDQLLHTLARKYGVSTQALVNRLKNLGYIQ